MERAIEEYRVTDEPYYLAVAREVELFEAAHAARLPVMLKGPTGSGKTRFVEHMAWRLERPLITVACHEDLSATDLVGRFLLEGEETIWHDGPLTSAVRNGAICYLDEVVEARKDTVVIIHPLTDDRRRLPIEKRGTILEAPDDFMLVVSYNPGYQSILKDLKQSTRQRFVALEFDYPPAELEAEIVAREGGVPLEQARDLVLIGHKVRNLRDLTSRTFDMPEKYIFDSEEEREEGRPLGRELRERLRGVRDAGERRTIVGLAREVGKLPVDVARAALEVGAGLAALSLRAGVDFLRAVPEAARVLDA